MFDDDNQNDIMRLIKFNYMSEFDRDGIPADAKEFKFPEETTGYQSQAQAKGDSDKEQDKQEKLKRQAAQIVGRMLNEVRDDMSKNMTVDISERVAHVPQQELDGNYLAELTEAIKTEINDIEINPDWAQNTLGAKKDENGEYNNKVKQLVKIDQRNIRTALRNIEKITVSTEQGRQIVWERSPLF